MAIEAVSRTPGDCTDAEIEAFCRLVRNGGQVHGVGLDERVQRAKRLVFLWDGPTLAGIAVIKDPTPHHRQHVFSGAHVSNLESEFTLELGYVVIDKSYKGQKLSRLAVDNALVGFATTALFATSRADRERMHRTLDRFNFVRVGDPYPSDEGEGDVLLFIRRAAQLAGLP